MLRNRDGWRVRAATRMDDAENMVRDDYGGCSLLSNAKVKSYAETLTLQCSDLRDADHGAAVAVLRDLEIHGQKLSYQRHVGARVIAGE